MDVENYDEWIALADAQEKGQDDCIPVFTMQPVQNNFETKKQNRPIFDEVPFVKILIAGDNKNVVERKVRDEDKHRWPRQWAEFMKKRENVPEGTPIEQWPLLNTAQVATFKALNIFTVEQIANMGDTGLQKMGPGARDIQARARQHLKPQSDVETELRSELADTQRALEDAQTRISTLEGKIEELSKPKRGRPRKEQAEAA